MPWTFNSSTGTLAHDGEVVTTEGWSGHDAGRNNPALESQANLGPIPRGTWSIGQPFDSESHGPVVMHLSPEEGTDTFSRGGFLIHGASVLNAAESSMGCVILPRSVRIQIAQSDDKILQVV